MIDHVAFLADDPAAFIKRLDAKGVPYRPRHLPDSNLFQLFLRDPNGVMINSISLALRMSRLSVVKTIPK